MRTETAPSEQAITAARLAPAAAPTPGGPLRVVCELDADGHVRAWTSEAQRELGWNAAEALGGLPPMIPTGAHAAFRSALERAVAGNSPGGVSATWSRKDGAPVEVEVSVLPCADGGGALCGFILIGEARAVEGGDQAQLEAYARDLRESYAREAQRSEELEQSYVSTVRALASVSESKHFNGEVHLRRIHALGTLFARVVFPEDVDDPQLSHGLLLHDIGKLAVPDALLTKPGRLTEEEMTVVRRHPEEGVRILRAVPFLDRAVHVVLFHHERWDGKGYPTGLAGPDIPAWARMFAIVDTVEAITSHRPHSPARPLVRAIGEVFKQAGKQFDPAYAQAFTRLDRAQVAQALEIDYDTSL